MCKTKNIQDFIKLQLDENIPKLERIIKQQSVGSSSRNSAFGDGLQQGSMCSELWWWWSEWEGFVGFKSDEGRTLTVSVASLLCECRCLYVVGAARLLSPWQQSTWTSLWGMLFFVWLRTESLCKHINLSLSLSLLALNTPAIDFFFMYNNVSRDNKTGIPSVAFVFLLLIRPTDFDYSAYSE